VTDNTGEGVVFLAFDNPKLDPDNRTPLLSCAQCRNKTYRVEIFEECGGRVYCAACNTYIGKMGWMPEEN